MPVSPVAQQFLVPQRQGEEIPDSQINTQGPFSAELSQPKFVAPNVKPSGFGGAGASLLHFANNFLAGASQGRLRQFQQSEQTKKEHERNYDATVQHILDSPLYGREFKERVTQDALRTKASASLAAMGGGKGGGKNEHPVVGMAKNIFTGIVGPSENTKHRDIDPTHVSDLISQMHDPANMFSMADASEKAGVGVGQVIKDMQEAAVKSGVPLYREDVPNHPKFAEVVRPLAVEGYNPLTNEGVTSRLASLPSRPSADAQRKANLPVPWLYRNEAGDTERTSVKIGLDNVVRDLAGVAIPPDDPRIRFGSQPGAYDSATVRSAGQKSVQELRNKGSLDVAKERNAKESYVVKQDTQGNNYRVQISGFKDLVPPMGAPTPQPPVVAPVVPGVTEAPPVTGAEAPAASVVIPQIAPGQPDRVQLAAKNNNPFNLEFRNQPGAVLGDDGRFAKFAKPEDGYQAGINQIELDKTRPQTLGQYIEKFAPPGGKDKNNTAQYIKNAAAALGVSPDTPLAQVDTNKLAQFQAHQESSTAVTGVAPASSTGQVSAAPPVVMQQPKGPHEGMVGTGLVKHNANEPVNWTPEQNQLAIAPVEPGKRRDAFLATWPLQDQLNMKLLADYKYKLPGGTKGALTSPLVRSYMASVQAYNPKWDPSKYDNRQALKKDADYGGRIYQNNTALNTALVHLGGLDDSTAALDNSIFKKYNTFGNWLLKESGSERVKPFETYRTAFNAEMARALKGGVADKSEIDDWKHNIDSADSPKALKSAYKSVANIIAGRIGQQEANYTRGMGEPPENPFVSPDAQQVLTRFGAGNPNGSANPTTSVTVMGHNFPNQAAADAFSKAYAAKYGGAK